MNVDSMMKKLATASLLLLTLLLLAVGVYWVTRPDPRLVVRADLDVSQALGRSGDAQFARALQPRKFSFPADHGPHLEYGVEWWYYTGNLGTPEGRHFGYELTLFRIGLGPEHPDRASDWAASQLYMGHFALTDVAHDRFYAFERFSRAGLGLAGASADNQGFQVWLEDWRIEGEGGISPTITLRAAEADIAIALTLESAKPLVLQGDRGLSQKSAAPGNASYYYSLTRLTTSGTVAIGEQSFPVSGSSWMDREWSTSALSEDQIGWDWFALQLSDGRELMYYQLLLKSGGVDPLSSGTVVWENGSKVSISPDKVDIQVLERWESPRGVSYPSRWRVKVPAQSIDVTVTPFIDDQELDLSVRYWEGAVRVEGASQGQPVTGVGYVEMTRPGGPASSGDGIGARSLSEYYP